MIFTLDRRQSVVALEMIDYQSNEFGNQIEAIMASLQEKIISKKYDSLDLIEKSSEIKDLTSLIFNRLGLSVQFDIRRGLAATMPFITQNRHIFLDDMFKGMSYGDLGLDDQKKFLNKSINKKGKVDLKNAKISGVFSEYKHTVYLQVDVLFKSYKMTPGEVTAVLLHELGHDFTFIEMSARLDTANEVLINILKTVSNKKDKKVYELVFKELKSINDKVSEEDVEDIVNGNRVVAGYKLWKTLLEGGILSTSNQGFNNKYDETASEQSADNFATRFGYGRELITGLNKLSMNSKQDLFMAISGLISDISLMAYIIGLISGGGALGVIVGIIIAIFGILLRGEKFVDYTYDTLKIRYKRIRQEYIGKIKTLVLDNNQLSAVISDVKVIDGFIDKAGAFKTPINILSNLIFTANRKANAAVVRERLLEDLAFNDLFLKAGEFKTMKVEV